MGSHRSSPMFPRIVALLAAVAMVSICAAFLASLMHIMQPLPHIESLKLRTDTVANDVKTKTTIIKTPATTTQKIHAEDMVFDFAFALRDGVIRFRLLEDATNAKHYIAALMDAVARGSLAALVGDGTLSSSSLTSSSLSMPTSETLQRMFASEWQNEESGEGLKFYRAEPKPTWWGSPDLPDSSYGGRWGPPYALLQGALRSVGAPSLKPPDAEAAEGAHPPLARGHVAWAGGNGGPDFFICTAEHPEWALGHSVFAEVLPADMGIVDAVVTHPLKVEDWGGVNVTVLVNPVPYVLLRP